jgi:hypothetical protein
VEREGEIVASLVHDPVTRDWYVELLHPGATLPTPFIAVRHTFRTFGEAARWLGYPEVAKRRWRRH